MSCTIEWERVVDLATRARDESVGADASTNGNNIDAVMAAVYDVAKRSGNTDAFTLEWGVSDE